MIIKVKDFTVTPVLCPAGFKDCSPCRHANKMTVKNPPARGTAPADFGEIDCLYMFWFEQAYNVKCNEMK